MPRRSFILIVGHGPELERDEGAAQTLRALGAHVRTLEMWEPADRVLGQTRHEVGQTREPRTAPTPL